MSIIVNRDTRVVVQGITGNEGSFHTARMLGYGTQVKAGVTPGKGGQTVEGVPVYGTVGEAIDAQAVNTSIVLVPPRFAAMAANEAIDAGIKVLVVVTEGIPQKDEMGFIARARQKGVIVVGPNCPGVISPGHRTMVGIMPAQIYRPGGVGIVSRSGTLTYEISWHISQAGLGQSTCVGIGGDPIVGLDFIRVLELFRDDDETASVVVIGEIGGNAEEMAARYIAETSYLKPVVAYVAGRTAPPEKRMGHAGAIVMGNAGTAQSKIEAYIAAGVPVAERPSEISDLIGRKIPGILKS
jgi:succinyl-CoA synthetase alpha subunit